MTLASYIESLKPKGIEISDNRSIGLSMSVRTHPFKLASISHTRNDGFYVNASGSWLSPKEAREYAKELIEAAEICETLNRLIAEETQQITSK